MDTLKLRTALLHDEGLRLRPYTDSVGKLTIGVGRNLTDRGLSTDEAMLLLDHDIALVYAQLSIQLWWKDLDDVRQRVLANMAFNLGTWGLLQFKNMLAAVRRADYRVAAQEMLNSRWAQQVGRRAATLALMMETGQDA